MLMVVSTSAKAKTSSPSSPSTTSVSSFRLPSTSSNPQLRPVDQWLAAHAEDVERVSAELDEEQQTARSIARRPSIVINHRSSRAAQM
jgi:hypothetical protein